MKRSLPLLISAGQAVAPRGRDDVAKSPAVGAVQPSRRLGFDGVLEQVAADAIGTLKAGEAASISSIQGKVSAQRVVEAVMSAEQTLADGGRGSRQGRAGVPRSQSNGDLI